MIRNIQGMKYISMRHVTYHTRIHTTYAPKNPILYYRAMCTVFNMWYSKNSRTIFSHSPRHIVYNQTIHIHTDDSD